MEAVHHLQLRLAAGATQRMRQRRFGLTPCQLVSPDPETCLEWLTLLDRAGQLAPLPAGLHPLPALAGLLEHARTL